MVRRYKRRGKSSFASRVKKIVQKTIEVKDCTQNFGTNTAEVSVTSAGTLTALFLPPMLSQGVGSDGRIGTEIKLLSSKLSIMCSQVDAPYNRVRYALLKCRTRPANVNALFNHSSFTTFGGIFAAWNYDIIERVHLDRTMMLRTGETTIPMTKFAKHYMKTPDKLHFQTNLSGPTEAWYLLFISDSAPLSVIHPTLVASINCRYTDQ